MFSQQWLWRICLLGYGSVYSTENRPALFRNILLPPSEWRVGQARNQHEACCFLPASFGFLLGLLTTLKMDAVCSYEMLVDFHWTTQCYVPEGRILHFQVFCEVVQDRFDFLHWHRVYLYCGMNLTRFRRESLKSVDMIHGTDVHCSFLHQVDLKAIPYV
jgi:hypothetical protein